MATNYIIPFATGNGATVPTDAAWAASGVIAQGFQNGVADPSLVNKALRQGTAAASGFAQFTAGYSGIDFTDSLTSQAMSDNFRIALAAALDGSRMGVDTSTTANAITFTLTPTPVTLAGNKVIWIKVANNNTGAMTVLVQGSNFSTLPLKRGDGSDVQSGDLVATKWYAATCDGTAFRLLALTKSELNALIAAAGGGTTPTGRLNTLVVFSTPGTTTWTCPAGVTIIRVRVIGAGGGGAANTGSGGGGGGYAEGWFTVTPGQSYTLVIGAGGTGVSSGNATNGGSTSFGTLGISATGGNGGGSSSGSPGTGGTGTGGQLSLMGGAGGDLDGYEVFAAGGTAAGMPSARIGGVGNYGEGGGASSPSGSPANTGFNGAGGLILID